ncbi:MAG: hypothetical protein RBR02_09625 [Desulfuromonadaceae bacterium]|nr:hypothetical protein [Desulfuromonadaceae bacterium]
MAKKKVSFDIDEYVLDQAKDLCDTRDIKFSDFVRDAVAEKIANDLKYFIIYAFVDESIKKFYVDKTNPNYKILEFPASLEMAKNLGAKSEGYISFTNLESACGDIKDDVDFVLVKKFERAEKLKFFTK